MHTGMLWFDNNSTTALTFKIEKALDYFRKKYGREPNLILINLSMLNEEKPEIGKITVRPYRPVLPDHLWIGIEDN